MCPSPRMACSSTGAPILSRPDGTPGRLIQKSWEVIEKIRQPNPALDFYVCGEAFAQVQGLGRGAINNAEMVLQKLGLPRAPWVRADYTFEYAEKGERDGKQALGSARGSR